MTKVVVVQVVLVGKKCMKGTDPKTMSEIRILRFFFLTNVAKFLDVTKILSD